MSWTTRRLAEQGLPEVFDCAEFEDRRRQPPSEPDYTSSLETAFDWAAERLSSDDESIDDPMGDLIGYVEQLGISNWRLAPPLSLYASSTELDRLDEVVADAQGLAEGEKPTSPQIRPAWMDAKEVAELSRTPSRSWVLRDALNHAMSHGAENGEELLSCSAASNRADSLLNEYVDAHRSEIRARASRIQ